MNVLKNFEFVFIIAVVVSFSVAAIADQPAPQAAKAPLVVAAAPSTTMITVVIPAKRLSTAEKAQLAAL